MVWLCLANHHPQGGKNFGEHPPLHREALARGCRLPVRGTSFPVGSGHEEVCAGCPKHRDPSWTHQPGSPRRCQVLGHLGSLPSLVICDLNAHREKADGQLYQWAVGLWPILVCSGPVSAPREYWVWFNHYSLKDVLWKLTLKDALWGEKFQWPNAFGRCCSIWLEIHNVHKCRRDFLEFSAPRYLCGSLPTFPQCYFPRRLFLMTQIGDPLLPHFSSHPFSFLPWHHILIYLFIICPPSTRNMASVSARTWSTFFFFADYPYYVHVAHSRFSIKMCWMNRLCLTWVFPNTAHQGCFPLLPIIIQGNTVGDSNRKRVAKTLRVVLTFLVPATQF